MRASKDLVWELLVPMRERNCVETVWVISGSRRSRTDGATKMHETEVLSAL